MPVSMSDIITFSVTGDQVDQAKSLREERDRVYGNIYPENPKDMRHCGDLGEIIAHQALQMCREEDVIWHNDLYASKKPDLTFCGIDLEVKTVKRKVPIRTYYKAQVTARHMNCETPWILFNCYQMNQQAMHLLGVMHKDQFRCLADYYGAGEQVHEAYTIRPGHEIYAVTIKDMIPVRTFLRHAMNGTLDRIHDDLDTGLWGTEETG